MEVCVRITRGAGLTLAMGGVRNEGELIGWQTARYRSADMTVRTVESIRRRSLFLKDLLIYWSGSSKETSPSR